MPVTPKIPKREATNEKVLSVSAALFAEKGFLATSMRDIATALKMKSGSLYYHQPSKEAILAAVLERGLQSIITDVNVALEACGTGATVREKFQAAMVANMKRVHSVGDIAFARARTLRYLPKASRNEQIRLRGEFSAIWRSLIEQGKRSGEIAASVNDVFAVMMIIAVNAYITEWFDPKRRTFEQLAAHYTHILFDGYGHMDDPGAGKPAARTNRKSREQSAHLKAEQAHLKRER